MSAASGSTGSRRTRSRSASTDSGIGRRPSSRSGATPPRCSTRTGRCWRPSTSTRRRSGGTAGFDGSALVGRSWQIGAFGLVGGTLANSYLDAIRFQIVAFDPETGEVGFRIAERVAGCLVFEDTAIVSETGELWSLPAFDGETPEGPARLYNLSLHLGWDGDDIGGLEVRGVVDSVPWSAAYGESEDQICTWMGAVGDVCEPCPEGESVGCLTWENADVTLVLADEPVLEVLPSCVDVEPVIVDHDCSCATTGALAPGAVGWMVLVLRRRRREAGQAASGSRYGNAPR